LDATAEERPFAWVMPSVAACAALFESAAGPFVALSAHAEAQGNADQVRAALLEVMEEANEATDGTCRLPAPYLLIQGHGPS
jgi:hypothetical protein